MNGLSRATWFVPVLACLLLIPGVASAQRGGGVCPFCMQAQLNVMMQANRQQWTPPPIQMPPQHFQQHMFQPPIHQQIHMQVPQNGGFHPGFQGFQVQRKTSFEWMNRDQFRVHQAMLPVERRFNFQTMIPPRELFGPGEIPIFQRPVFFNWGTTLTGFQTRFFTERFTTNFLKRFTTETRTAFHFPAHRIPAPPKDIVVAKHVNQPPVPKQVVHQPQPHQPAPQQRHQHRPVVEVQVKIVGVCGQCHHCKGGNAPNPVVQAPQAPAFPVLKQQPQPIPVVRNQMPGFPVLPPRVGQPVPVVRAPEPGFPVLPPRVGQPMPVVRNQMPGFPVLNPGQLNPAILQQNPPMPFLALLPPALPELGPVEQGNRLTGKPVLPPDPLPEFVVRAPAKPKESLGLMQPEKTTVTETGSLDKMVAAIDPPELAPLQGTTVQVLPGVSSKLSAENLTSSPAAPTLNPDQITQAPALAPLPTAPPLGLTLLPAVQSQKPQQPTSQPLSLEVVMLPPELPPLPPLQP